MFKIKLSKKNIKYNYKMAEENTTLDLTGNEENDAEEEAARVAAEEEAAKKADEEEVGEDEEDVVEEDKVEEVDIFAGLSSKNVRRLMAKTQREKMNN